MSEVVVILLLAALFVIPAIRLLFLIQETLKEISPHNRRFKPSYVWFLLIPVVGPIYTFFLSFYLSLSLRLELKERGVRVSRYPSLFMGLMLAAIQLLAHFSYFKPYTKFPFFLCLILYWHQISQYKRQLTATSPIQTKTI